jgi:CRISPR-associated protein Cas1
MRGSDVIAPLPPSLDLTDLLTSPEELELVPDEDLIPVRMLNEYTYCPRLAYIEWVQGEFTDNLDTKQGTFGHRNVDKESTKPVPDGAQSQTEDRELTARSLTLSAPREGLVAKLDVLELNGPVATPVEYKKGAIPQNAEQAWEPERVQLCAQVDPEGEWLHLRTRRTVLHRISSSSDRSVRRCAGDEDSTTD